MDLVVPFKTSRWNNTELKYALRSACMYLLGGYKQVTDMRITEYSVGGGIGYDHVKYNLAWDSNIFIIGDNPNLKKIIHIPATDNDQSTWKEKNIFEKVLIACNDDRVSDDFIFLNDDHFILPGFDINKYYAMEWAPRIHNPYQNTIDNTLSEIDPVYNFDVHCPMIINKAAFIAHVASWDWNKKYGYCMKTVYCHSVFSEPTLCTDMKLGNDQASYKEIMAKIEGRAFWSIAENMRSNDMLAVLNEKYPVKSIYE